MNEFKIWDAHVHLFPPEVYHNWEKYAARDDWFRILTQKPPEGKGVEETWCTAEEALETADRAGVYGLAMLGWYWNDPGLQTMHNDYMAEMFHRHPDRLMGFCSINPKFKQDSIREIERCAKLGFHGIGELGPGGNGYDFNDPDFIEVCQCAMEHDLPINIHCGEPVGHQYPGKDMTSLAPIPELVMKYPKLKLILAHMGGGLPFYEMNPKLQGIFDNVRYDMAANPLLYRIDSIRAVIHMIGQKRLFFGSDFPLTLYPRVSREMDMNMFVDDIRDNAGLTEEEWYNVMGNNFLEFMGRK